MSHITWYKISARSPRRRHSATWRELDPCNGSGLLHRSRPFLLSSFGTGLDQGCGKSVGLQGMRRVCFMPSTSTIPYSSLLKIARGQRGPSILDRTLVPTPRRPEPSRRMTRCGRFRLIRQRERENVPARSDRDVLLALDRVGHRRAFPDLIRLEVPQRLTALGVDRRESSSRLAVEH